jgi:hypothetical protein
VVPFLRSMGVKIGRRAEVSTARGINFELTEIGDESFVADHVLIGNETMRNHTVTLRKTVLKDRAFVGNAALVHQGCELASNTLVGVLSTTPEKPLQEGQSCFGSPPILMPVRQQARTNHPEHLLYRPRRSQIALRLFIEGARILLPRFVITCALGFSTLILSHIYDHFGIIASVFMLPLVYLFGKHPTLSLHDLDIDCSSIRIPIFFYNTLLQDHPRWTLPPSRMASVEYRRLEIRVRHLNVRNPSRPVIPRHAFRNAVSQLLPTIARRADWLARDSALTRHHGV